MEQDRTLYLDESPCKFQHSCFQFYLYSFFSSHIIGDIIRIDQEWHGTGRHRLYNWTTKAGAFVQSWKWFAITPKGWCARYAICYWPCQWHARRGEHWRMSCVGKMTMTVMISQLVTIRNSTKSLIWDFIQRLARPQLIGIARMPCHGHGRIVHEKSILFIWWSM